MTYGYHLDRQAVFKNPFYHSDFVRLGLKVLVKP